MAEENLTQPTMLTLLERIDSLRSVLSERMDSLQSELAQRLDSLRSELSDRLDSIDERLTAVETAIGELRSAISELRSDTAADFRGIQSQFDYLTGEIGRLKISQNYIEQQLRKAS